MEEWAGKRHREMEEEGNENATKKKKKSRSDSERPPFNGYNLSGYDDAKELFWSVMHGCKLPDGEVEEEPPLPKGKLKIFKKIQPAYAFTNNQRQGHGIIIAEDATASKAWLLARGLDADKTWKRFYTVSLNTYYHKLLLANEVMDRCFYEVLREEAPCHAFADVEIYPATNPRMQTMAQFNEFMDIFLGIFEKWLADFFNVEVTRYTLESSRYDRTTGEPTKFSRHYKWTLSYGPTNFAMFENVMHVGALMRRFECFIINTYGPSTRDGNIFYFWKDKIKHSPPDAFKDKSSPFDYGVYTRGRMFRVKDSHKIGGGADGFLMAYEKAGDEKKPPEEYPSLESTIRYSLLCPPPEACGHPLHLLALTEPDGSAPSGTSNLYAHRAQQHPRHISVHTNGTSINDNHIPRVNDFITYDDDDDDNYADREKPLCRGNTWNGHNGTSKKPAFCTAMSSAFCAAFSEELAKWGRRKNRTVPQLKMDHADFNRNRMQFMVTFKNYCHVLHADPTSNTVKHRSNRGFFRINLTDMTYVCHCLDPDHRGRASVPQNIMPAIKEKFGARVEKFIVAFNERYGLDPAREMYTMFSQLQIDASASEEEEEESSGENACQGTISG